MGADTQYMTSEQFLSTAAILIATVLGVIALVVMVTDPVRDVSGRAPESIEAPGILVGD